jgi:hypothetical protein
MKKSEQLEMMRWSFWEYAGWDDFKRGLELIKAARRRGAATETHRRIAKLLWQWLVTNTADQTHARDEAVKMYREAVFGK